MVGRDLSTQSSSMPPSFQGREQQAAKAPTVLLGPSWGGCHLWPASTSRPPATGTPVSWGPHCDLLQLLLLSPFTENTDSACMTGLRSHHRNWQSCVPNPAVRPLRVKRRGEKGPTSAWAQVPGGRDLGPTTKGRVISHTAACVRTHTRTHMHTRTHGCVHTHVYMHSFSTQRRRGSQWVPRALLQAWSAGFSKGQSLHPLPFGDDCITDGGFQRP